MEEDIRETIKNKLLRRIDKCQVGTGEQREAMRAFAEFCMALETEKKAQQVGERTEK